MFKQAVQSAQGAGWHNADALLAGLARVQLFCGGYGSGKTEVAVNFAMRLREAGKAVSIADLDIVNPYFRSREVRAELRKRGIEVLVPAEALVNADLPIVIPEIQGALTRSDACESGDRASDVCPQMLERSPGVFIIDLGGDPVGARVMASLAAHVRIQELSNCFVLNSRRPATRTVAGALKMMDGISAAAGIGITGIVVNSHLADETTAEVIAEGIALAEEIRAETAVEIAFVAVERQMVAGFDVDKCRYPVMVMDRFMLKPWERSNWLGKYRISN
jgi:hypothetical protein